MGKSMFPVLAERLFPNGEWTYSFQEDGSINTAHSISDPYEISVVLRDTKDFTGLIGIRAISDDSNFILVSLQGYTDSSKLLLDLFANMVMFETETRKLLGF